MTSTRRCQQCGLTQLGSDTCRRCGAPLVQPTFSRPRPSRVGAGVGVRPLVGIWLSPRETIRSLVARDPTRGVLVISWFAGVGFFLDALMPKVQDKFPAGAAVVGAVVAGPLLSFSLVFIEALLTAFTGRLLGGRAGSLELRAALAWANAPLLWLLVMWAVALAVGGAVPRMAMGLVGVGLLVWAEILAVVLVAEVHALSVGRALGALLLAWLIKVSVVIGIVVLLAGEEHRGSPPESNPREAAAIVR